VRLEIGEQAAEASGARGLRDAVAPQRTELRPVLGDAPRPHVLLEQQQLAAQQASRTLLRGVLGGIDGVVVSRRRRRRRRRRRQGA
jgi:hypothetical protein